VKILHLYKDYYPVVGGMENHIRILAEGSVKRGLEVTVLVTSLTRRTEIRDMKGVKVIKAGRVATLASTPLSFSFFSWVRRLKPDLTHLHFPYPWGEMAHLMFGRSQRTVITYQSDIVRQKNILKLYRPFLKQVLARADRIIATSPQYVRNSPYLSGVADKCVIIPLGIELEPLQRPRKEEVRKLRSEYTPPLLLFVGVLRYYKGLEYLIRAMKQIDARLLVVGSGPMAEQWQTMAVKLGLTDKVLFVGQVADEDLPAYYQACDLFVLPASHRSEAFGTVQIEAMACGKAVISTELGTGTSYVNIDGETGLVVPARDTDALTEAINRLLSDDVQRTEMGEKGGKRATREFSHEIMIDRVLALYQSLLQG
jgi:glycosyltransferase involved in cell wall biosynthesis